jgi:DNA polymerase-3 subunit epsilon
VLHGLIALRRRWMRSRLARPELAFMFDEPPAGEWVSLDCETTGLDVRRDSIVSIGAVPIVGSRLLTSRRLELLVRPPGGVKAASVRIHRLREVDVAQGLEPEEALARLLHFVGSRPLVGYYLEFDIAMLDRIAVPALGVRLPQARIEVSSMYYDYRNRRMPAHLRGGDIDLRLATMMNDLGLPLRDAHDAVNDAVMAALAFVKLRTLLGER